MSTKMEQPFYHDDSFLLGYGHSDAALHDYKLQQKQAMNPNLAEPYRSLKAEQYAASLSSDTASLKLASPELERLIIQNSNGVITSPTPGQYLYGRGITDEQEGFAEGFVKALDELHKMNQHPPPNVAIGAGGVTTCSGAAAAAAASVFGSSLQPEPPIYTTLNAYCPTPSLSSLSTPSSASSSASSAYPSATISYLPPHVQQHHHHHHHHQHQQQPAETTTAHAFQNLLPGATGVHPHRFSALKEEPQTVPEMHSSTTTSSEHSSPPMSPIDLESQERIKAERKRLRNRLAATKCRRRKLERIARLEDRVKVLKSDNAGLSSTATVLREQVAQLKQKVLRHVSSGCQLMLTSKMEAF